MKFEKDWRGIISTVLWGWILWFIPIILKGIEIYNTEYSVDMNAGILEYKHGLINKKQDNIELYRIKNVSANESLVSGGQITITNQDGTVQVLPYIKNANNLSVQLRNLANKKREDQTVRPLEFM